MKRILSIIMFSALLTCTAMGQIQSHTWEMGPLTWNDFQHKTALNGHYSFMEYYMGFDQSRKVVDGVTYVGQSVYAFVSPEYSWADTAHRSPALLRYNQTAFGLMEVYRRRLERRMFTANLYINDQQMLDNTMRQLNDDIDRLEAETRQGSDSAVLARVGGNLHRYFGNGMGMSFNFDMGWRRHFLTFGMGFAGSRCRDTVFSVHSTPENIEDLWTGDRLAVLDLYAAYGFSVLDNARCRLTPFVGYGLVGFFFTPDNGSSIGPSTGSIHAGVDFNLHFSNQVFRLPYSILGYNATHDLASLNIKAFGTYGRLNSAIGAPAGFTFNVQVGFSFLSGKAKSPRK